MDGGQGARTGTLLGLGVARAGRALGAGKDAARSEDQDLAVGELLLELTGQAKIRKLVLLSKRRARAERGPRIKTYRC